jgi:hypothetical protein
MAAFFIFFTSFKTAIDWAAINLGMKFEINLKKGKKMTRKAV